MCSIAGSEYLWAAWFGFGWVVVNSFNGSRNVLVAEFHWLHPALVGGASPAWRWDGRTGGGTKSGGGSMLDWGEARGAVVRGTGRGILEIRAIGRASRETVMERLGRSWGFPVRWCSVGMVGLCVDRLGGRWGVCRCLD